MYVNVNEGVAETGPSNPEPEEKLAEKTTEKDDDPKDEVATATVATSPEGADNDKILPTLCPVESTTTETETVTITEVETQTATDIDTETEAVIKSKTVTETASTTATNADEETVQKETETAATVEADKNKATESCTVINDDDEVMTEVSQKQVVPSKDAEVEEEQDGKGTRKTIFVNFDANTANDAGTVPEMPMESDPIQILDDEDKEMNCMVDDEDVLVDSSAEEKYFINKCNEDEEKPCMICCVTKKAIYSCSYKSVSYICGDECFERFKKDKEGKFHVMQTIRVKSFNTITSKENANLVEEKCKACCKVVGIDTISLATFSFCDARCLKDHYRQICATCVVCKKAIDDEYVGKYWIRFGLNFDALCSFPCFKAYKKPEAGYCQLCKTKLPEGEYCDDRCRSDYAKIDVVKDCSVCHNGKQVEIQYVTDEKTNNFCGDPCFVAYKFVNKVEPKECEVCRTFRPAERLMTIEHSVFKEKKPVSHYICSEKCRAIYVVRNDRNVNCCVCESKKNCFDAIKKQAKYYCSLYCYQRLFIKTSVCTHCKQKTQTLVKQRDLNFCNVQCFNNYEFDLIEKDLSSTICTVINAEYYDYGQNGTASRVPFQEMIYLKPPEIVQQRNVATMVRPNMVSKGVTCKPRESTKAVQTDEEQIRTLVIPIPVPVFVPVPVHMFVEEIPVPFPVPIPIPVPIWVPTRRNTAKGILKEITKVKNKIPADPLEAELLMMAEFVAEDKKDDSNSDSDEDDQDAAPPSPISTIGTTTAAAATPAVVAETFPEAVTASSVAATSSANFGEDMLQMALKMATDFEEPVDLEGEVSVSTIGPSTSSQASLNQSQSYEPVKKRGRPRSLKRARAEVPVVVNQPTTSSHKPDANLCLKFTFGVNAWKQWVTIKNSELEKTSKRPKLFKTEILQLTSDELNFSLCLFVKEVRKPNGTEYAPDTIYYLCLGIQQFLYENNRIDNIFCDTFYEKFTDCLNEVCKRFSMLYNESQYIVTRVEEEHLWESKQLGAHSPLVLLNTLMFFNTKHFSLTTVEEHLQLSFSHIMKHWKRNPNMPGARNVLLRFYPPQNAQIENKKKKMYEQQENEDNPIRCPVKLYEFYLSKCPESVKTRNDVFYLLPERSCVPDSPLWYSTMALDEPSLDKMLNRVKMVKEINIALLST